MGENKLIAQLETTFNDKSLIMAFILRTAFANRAFFRPANVSEGKSSLEERCDLN